MNQIVKSQMRRNPRRLLVLTVFLLLACGMSARAENGKGWVKKKNQVYYYENRKPVTGLKRIGRHDYYFDSKGVQGTSWRKIGNDYYYFRCEEKAEGYLLKNTDRNGIKLGKDGKAILSSDRAKKKADLMARVSVYLDKIIAKQKAVLADKRIKLRVCYDYLRKNYPYRYVSHFMKKDRDFDLKSVEVILDCGYADCHPYAFTFAYLSNALGFSDITVYSWFSKKWQTGHSWVRIGNRVYDVSLGRHNRKSYELFGMGWSRYCRKYSYYKIKAERHLDKL